MQPLKTVRIGLLLVLLLLSVTVYAQDQGFDTVTTTNVSLRSGPGTEWRRITTLPTGTAVRLDGQAFSGAWVRGIASTGDIGWMLSANLNMTADAAAALRPVLLEDPFTLPAPAAANPPAEVPPAAAPTEVPGAVAPPANLPPTNVRGFNLGGHVDGMGANAINQMHRAGMTWVKRQLRDFQDPAPWIAQAHANGFRILFGMLGPASQVTNPGYIDQYIDWVAQAAALGADAIEVWNEPNIQAEWQIGAINAQSYTDLLRRAYNAIKAANPNTMVISAAPAPTGFFGGCSLDGCDDNRYIEGMRAAGALNYMDCIGIHYNEGVVAPDATSGDPRGNSTYYTRYFWGMINTYVAVFGRSRPLCFTEFGYLTSEGLPPLPGSFGWANHVTLANQAAWLDQAVALAANSGLVRMLIIWNVDFTNYSPDPMAGWAIVRPDGSCPACDALGS